MANTRGCCDIAAQVMDHSAATMSSASVSSSHSSPSSTQTFRCRSSGTSHGSWWTSAVTKILHRRSTWSAKFCRRWRCLFTIQTRMYETVAVGLCWNFHRFLLCIIYRGYRVYGEWMYTFGSRRMTAGISINTVCLNTCQNKRYSFAVIICFTHF